MTARLGNWKKIHEVVAHQWHTTIVVEYGTIEEEATIDIKIVVIYAPDSFVQAAGEGCEPHAMCLMVISTVD